MFQLVLQQGQEETKQTVYLSLQQVFLQTVKDVDWE